MVLPDDVGGEVLFLTRAREEKRERVPKDARKPGHPAIVSLPSVKKPDTSGRYAERVLRGVDDQGGEERIVIWIERRPGAVWAVGRAINPQHRQSEEPRRDDYIFEGYELEDALENANAALEDDVRVLEQDGFDEHIPPFKRKDLLKPLERLFFGRT